MLSTKVAGGDEAYASLENEFFAEMFNYLQMLFKEYQEGATPCISREQAEQLQRLLRIPRTSMDIKRRKKNSADGGTGQLTALTPTLPSINDFVALHHVLSSTSQALTFDNNDDTVAQAHSSDVPLSSNGSICVHTAATPSSNKTLAVEANIPSRVLLPQQERPEYEVLLSPHVDFGIGLRFEARNVASASNAVVQGAIAKSFIRHPLSGSIMPAEESGMITLGDSLVGVNDLDLSQCSFEEIIENNFSRYTLVYCTIFRHLMKEIN